MADLVIESVVVYDGDPETYVRQLARDVLGEVDLDLSDVTFVSDGDGGTLISGVVRSA